MAEVSVIGVGITSFAQHLDKTLVDLGVEAARSAILDSGLAPNRMEAGFFANVLGGKLTGDTTMGQTVFNEVGVSRVLVANVENACASGSTAFCLAYNAVAAGQAEVALVVGAEKMCIPGMGLLAAGEGDLDAKLGMVMPASFALRANRHMHDFGTTPEQMAQVTVKNRRHAALNPGALFQKEVSLDEVLESPMIADPLTRFQCCPMADGAAALVLAGGAVAKNGRSVGVDAAVLCSGSYQSPWDAIEWETDFRGINLAYEKAGIGPEDLDVAECHDAFTIAEIAHVEAMGLCPPGEGGRLTAEGGTALGGQVAVNTSGGLIGRGHPLAATGVAQVVEVVEQLRGEAGKRQAEGAKVGLAQCMGADMSGDTKSCTVAVLSK